MNSASKTDADGTPRGKGPAWLGSGAARGRGQAKQAASWHQSPAGRTDPEANRNLIRAIVAVLAIGLIAAFAYFLLLRLERTAVIVFRAGEYPRQMPPLAFAQEDAELLGRVNAANLRLVGGEAVLMHSRKSLAAFGESLKAAGKHRRFGRGHNAVLVYLAAHGMVDRDGEACLVPSRGEALDSSTWLKLTDVLKTLADESALRETRKLVVLDCQRTLSCWRAGWLENRFAEALPAALGKISDPNLYVLTAAGDDEIAYSAPELRGSVFGHFLAQSLQGPEGQRGGSVTLAGLYRTVLEQVDNYALSHRGAHQRPVLWHAGRRVLLDTRGHLVDAGGAATAAPPPSDFGIAYVSWFKRRPLESLESKHDAVAAGAELFGASPGSDFSSAATAKRTLRYVWQLYAERSRDPAESGQLPGYVTNPVAWADVQQRVAAVGERVFAGEEYQKNLGAEIDALVRDLQSGDKWRPAGTTPRLSAVAERRASAMSRPPDRAAREDASPPQNIFLEYVRRKAEPPKQSELLASPGVNESRLIHDIEAILTDRQAPAEARRRLADAAAMLAQFRQQSPGSQPLIESQFVALLNAGLPAEDAATAGRLATAIQARQAAEQAATPLDLRVHYAVERLVNQADAERRQAEDANYLGIQPQVAERAWRDCMGDANGRSGYLAAQARGANLAAALALRDEVWADLPLVAEWHLAQAHWAPSSQGAASSQAIEAILRLLEASDADRSSGEGLGVFALNRCIELMIQSRDEPAMFGDVDGQLQAATSAVEKDWRRIVGEFHRVYEVAAKEVDFRTGEGYRVAESALGMPPLGLKSGAKELDPFAELMLLATGSRSPRTVSASGEPKKAANRRRLFRELHRALDYPFDGRPYGEHRAKDAWNETKPGEVKSADAIFGDRNAHIASILDEYNKLGEPAESDGSRRAVAAAAGLRQWDARVRVGSPWLALFTDDEKTPARRLQKFDARHFTSFQAYRVLQDYWGTGQSPGVQTSDARSSNGPSSAAQATPFFAEAIERCRQSLAANEASAALHYDPPVSQVSSNQPSGSQAAGGQAAGGQGSSPVDFSAAEPPALAALKQWKAIAFPAGALTSGAGRRSLRLSVEPLAGASGPAVGMPGGIATLSIVSASGVAPAEQAEFAGGQHAEAVAMPVNRTSPPTIEARLPAEKTGSSPALQARLWYRGHVRAAPLPEPGGGQFIEYTFTRPKYGPPTVVVQGKDTIRGTVLFVFDCSASMRGPPGATNFSQAQNELRKVLADLGQRGAASLRVGLMVYGTRTPADANPPIYPRDSWRNTAPPNASYPHPDADVQTLVSVQGGTTRQVLAELNKLSENDCKGVTPLYYAITKAIQEIQQNPDAAGRNQIIVISDGVNMPYSAGQRNGRYEWGPIGKEVDQQDQVEVEKALQASAGRVEVTVQLFGQLGSLFEQARFRELTGLRRQANFHVEQLERANLIADSIWKSFPKTRLEVRPHAAGAAVQSLAFDQQAAAAGWEQDGLPRRSLEPFSVQVYPPGDKNPLTQRLDFRGGEQVVLDYDGSARDNSLTLASDGFRGRDSTDATPPRGEAGRRTVVEAMDPERSGTRITRLNFRLHDREARLNFTPRPKYVWLEMKPLGAAAEKPASVFPLIDPIWHDNVNLPWLEAPVEGWPDDCQAARAELWFRNSDPGQPAAMLESGGPGKSFTRGAETWRIEQSGGTAGEPRRITVACRPEGSAATVETLLRRGVWLWPPPDKTTRRYQRDGTLALHEFIYERPENSTIEVRICDREQFAAEAYSAELEFSLAN